VFGVIAGILHARMQFEDKARARAFFHRLTQTTKDWNRIDAKTPEFREVQARIEKMVAEVAPHA
jgi:V/A-type H+-transporting ATPase subunit A